MTNIQTRIIDCCVYMGILAVIGITAMQIDNKLAGYVAVFAITLMFYNVFRTLTMILDDHQEEVVDEGVAQLQADYDYEQSLQSNEGYYDRHR